ncbi:MAG: MarR family transcriptional regulator [Candidatus Nomurabacteria bacterium]|jgi:DNA-binding MarR family transcriptional regulator|nr:MarR family transcriptional regulator [Candidatus Nomurabacteria bacterium]
MAKDNSDDAAKIRRSLHNMRRLMFQRKLAGGGAKTDNHLPAPAYILLSVIAERAHNRQKTTVGDLAAELHVSKSAVAQLLNILEDRAIIERVKSADDRRITYVAISRRGQKFQKDSERGGDNLDDLLEFLGEDDAGDLVRLVGRIDQWLQIKFAEKENRGSVKQ